jgi:hypothetical protein
MWEILNFLTDFCPLKIQINSKKPGFERENQLKTLTLGPMAQATLVSIEIYLLIGHCKVPW